MIWCNLRNITSKYKGILFLNSYNEVQLEFLTVSKVSCSDGCLIYGNEMNNISSNNLKIVNVSARSGSIIYVDFNNTVISDFLNS